MTALSLAETDRRRDALARAREPQTVPPLALVDEPAPLPQRREPDRPVVTITISGPARSGKSVLALVLLRTLSDLGIVAAPPADLRSIRWRGPNGALDNLIERQLSVVIEKREDRT